MGDTSFLLIYIYLYGGLGRSTGIAITKLCKNKKHIQRTGAQDYNSVKVVWFERPWLGEIPADFYIFLTVP